MACCKWGAPMDIQDLREAVGNGAAFRRRRRLQPVGGIGDKIFPPTYPGADGPQHVFETRRVKQTNGEMADVPCVLIDSVQSQANRLEEALEAAALLDKIELPRILVDFAGAGFNSVGAISDLVAPHRIFDAILRDSELDGTAFRESEVGRALRLATLADASAILDVSPASLLFGAWNSTGEGGGLGAKFARAIVSEIVGVNVQASKKASVRVDPLGIRAAVKIVGDVNNWRLATDEKEKDAKSPSAINHSNVIASGAKGQKINIWEQGVTCDYAEQTSVITLAGLRRLSFSGRSDNKKDEAGRAYLAALGLLALMEGDRNGYALRSRCDLACEGSAPIELVRFDGSSEVAHLSADAARTLYAEALGAARAAGFKLSRDPIALKPSEKLAELVRQSQQKAMNDETDAGGD